VRGNDDAVLLEAGLTLNDEGECRLRTGEQELTFWQFRKRALYNLFFKLKEPE
jgi:hypothetical protein